MLVVADILHVAGEEISASVENVPVGLHLIAGVGGDLHLPLAMNSGDVFSYNETVGQRTEAKGYKAAPAYVQGETVDEIGGGVCQPSR